MKGAHEMTVDEQRERRADADTEAAEPTPTEVDTALQQAQRREAAMQEGPTSEDQVFDSANEGGMGPQGSGHGRRSGRHS